jgi:hypothetical protein
VPKLHEDQSTCGDGFPTLDLLLRPDAWCVGIRGKGQYDFVSGNLHASDKDSQRVLALAEQMQDHDCLLEAHHLNWSTLCYMGNFGAAHRHAEAGEALYQRERDHRLTYIYSGHDPGVCSRGFGALVCCQLGLGLAR